MNCRFARQLISPYLDGQLTGREMLALGDHLADCESCRQEMHSLRQVKALLRGLATPRPPLELSRQLSSQEIYAQSLSRHSIFKYSFSLPPRPQRGRRLIAALALSCLTLLALAPASRDGQPSSSSAVTLSSLPAPGSAGAQLLPPDSSPLGPSAFAISGSSRSGVVTFADFSSFSRDYREYRDFSIPPAYSSSTVPFAANASTDKTTLIGYHHR